MITIEMKNRRGFLLKHGKVWINGVDHSFRSKVAPDGINLLISDLPIGQYEIWIGAGRGMGIHRSRKITIDYNGSPVKLQCKVSGLFTMLMFGWFCFPFANIYYKLKTE